MNDVLLDQIVNATLYEGYILYPYRASSPKNKRERFTFGRVYPEAYSGAQNGAEPCSAKTECLVQTSGPKATLEVRVRFLHPVARDIGVLEKPLLESKGAELEYRLVPELRVGEELFQTWHEAIEREVRVQTVGLSGESARSTCFQFWAAREIEPLRDGDRIVGVAVRRSETLRGSVSLAVHPLTETLFKISVRVLNHSPMPGAQTTDSDAVMLRLFASTHMILHVNDADFVSQTDPPAPLKSVAESCQNIGVWPVLVGDEAADERDTILASPIILYDYPKIAPESAGSLFDGTEIDEILTLRILTMTDEEKSEMRGVDEQARRLLERTERLTKNSLLRMHGTMREAPKKLAESVEFDDFFGSNIQLEGVLAGGVLLQPGDRVRLRPKVRADIIDMAVEGKTAIVEAVEQDLEQRIHLAVVLESDPGMDLGMMRQPGHRFFYGLDEVEPLGKGVQ